MALELEAKFLEINPELIREKLRAVGATLVHPERLMKRKNFDFPDLRLSTMHNGWVRVRDEGDKVTVSYKQVSNRELAGTQEIEITANDYESACDFLEAIGLKEKTYQETKREKWALGECEVTIDTWPWIPPVLEVEGPSENDVREAVSRLGLAWSDAVHGDIAIAYRRHYDVDEQTIYRSGRFAFDAPCPWQKKQ